MSMFRGGAGAPGLYPPRIACFVCGAEVPADYPLYSEPPPGNPGTTPHFPFLLTHEPPMGCRPPSPGGVAKSCRVCYSTLMRQWDEYEKGGVTTDRRVYWLKRVDGLPFPSAETQVRMSNNSRKRSAPPTMGLMAAPPPVPAAVSLHQVQFDVASDRLKSTSSPLTVATMGVASSVSPLATPVTLPHSSPSSSTWSRRALAPQSASSAPSSLIQLSSDRGESSLVNVSDTDSGALDLSSGSRDRENMKSRSSVASHLSHHSSSYQSEGTSATSSASANAISSGNSGPVTDIVDLTLPDKNATFEVCYVCGDEFKRGALAYSFAKQVTHSEPFYPSLMCHPRPARSRPMDSAGRVQTCDECHEHLLAQWYTFDSNEVPHSDRNYTLRKRQVPLVDTTTFVCYICALDYHSSSLRLLYSRPNTENEPYYPFIQQQKPPPGASPISPQGMVQVCTLCYKSTKEKHHGFMKADQPPPKKRRGNSHTFSLPRDPGDFFDTSHQEEEEKIMPSDVTCPLCRRKFSIGSFKLLHSQPPPLGGLPYFPFLNELPMPDDTGDMDEDKQCRVRACQACTTSLINQWTTYQRDQISIEERSYLYQSPLGPRSTTGGGRPLTPTSLRLQKVGGTPDKQSRSSNSYSQLSENCNSKQQASVVAASRPRSDNRDRHTTNSAATPTSSHSPSFSSTDRNNMDEHSQHSSSSKPAANSSSFYCFLCGLHSELSFSRMLYSTAPGKKAPFFPFMKKHVPKNRAETLREDGTALVCTFCYHSVMVQWARYNEAKVTAYVDPNERTYNLHDYRCYVCGITTYRKRIRALRVMDFPFLRHHKPRKGVITMENGEMVAVCLDCFESLRGQFIEAGKYGIPIEKRQYNWMQIPPPPEGEGSLQQIITPQERLSQFTRPAALAPSSLAAPPVTTIITATKPAAAIPESSGGAETSPAAGTNNSSTLGIAKAGGESSSSTNLKSES